MYNILLIEDDRPLNKAISVYFKKEKFYVLSSFSGQEALDILSQNNLDLIILDINLPDLSGFDLIEQIKIINSNIPILILSACDLDSAILHSSHSIYWKMEYLSSISKWCRMEIL